MEVVRRRLFVLSLIIAFFFFLASLMPTLFGSRETLVKATGQHVPVPVMLAVFLGIPMLKFFAAVEAIALACSAISGEAERGLLAVILPKPLARWQVVTGKWIAVNAIMAANLLFWTGLGWVSLRIQTHHSYGTVLLAGIASTAYAVIFSTLTL